MPASEEWRPIDGHPGYEVSSLGRVRSPRGLLNLHPNSVTGYLYVALGRHTRRAVHVLVAEAFHGARARSQVVRHLDGSRQNNVVSNLAVGTYSENAHDAVRHGTHHMARKTHCIHGHEFTPENTVMNGSARGCRTCRRARRRAYRERQAFRAAGVEAVAR
jgi:hypothetical protein